MNIPFSRFTGFVVRFFRYFTRQIAHPVSAWLLFLMLVSSPMVKTPAQNLPYSNRPMNTPMNSPSNNSPGLVLRSLSIVTEIITHPYVAWFLFVMLGLYNGLVGWGMQQFLEANATTQSVRLEFDHHLLESQKEILEKLEKALAASGNSQ